jgi:hypothetical protein
MPRGVYERTPEYRKNVSIRMKGGKLTELHKQHIKDGSPRLSGKDNVNWIDGVPKNKFTIHNRIRTMYGTASSCENADCLKKSTSFHWSNKDHKYDSLSRDKWQQLCVQCHKIYDFKHHIKKGNK